MMLEVEVGEISAPRESYAQEALHLGHGDVGGDACAFVGHPSTIAEIRGLGVCI